MDVVDYLLDPGDKEILGNKTGVVCIAQGNGDSKSAVESEIPIDFHSEILWILAKTEVEEVNLEAVLAEG
jgi:hypothetical protein